VRRWMVEAQLEADLGEHTTARLRYTKFDWDDTYGVGNTVANSISPFDITSTIGAGTQALYYNPAFGYAGANPGVSDPYRVNTNAPARGSLSDHHRLNFDLTSDLGWATLHYLAGYQQYTYDTTSDLDLTPRTGTISIPVAATATLPAFTATGVSTDARTYYEERQKWLSNEINLSSPRGGNVSWIVGLFQYYQKYDQPQGIQMMGDPALLTPANGRANPTGSTVAVNGHLETESYAAFGQVDWTFQPTLTLTAGLRYTYDKKTGWDYARYISRTPTTAAAAAAAAIPTGTPPAVANAILAGALPVTQGLALDVTPSVVCGTATFAGCAGNPTTADLVQAPEGGLRRNLAGDWDALTGTLALRWQPDSTTNVYFRYARGYKSGGWLGASGLSPSPYAAPEYIDNFELGAKRTFGGTLQANAALFYSNYRGFQAPLSVPLGGITATQFVNLDARIWGFELESQWSPIQNLQLLLNYAYLNTELRNGCCYINLADPNALATGARPVGAATAAGQPQSLAGNDLPLSPHNKVTVGATYTWDFTPGSLIASATYSWTDKQQSTIFADPIYTTPSLELADFRLLWREAQRRYTVIAFLKNAFNEVGYGSSTANPMGVTAVGARQFVTLIAPRTYGLELQYRF